MLYVSLICLLLIITAITGTPDYYWRPFDGTIPTDAFLAATDGVQNTYVGNVPIFEGGLYIGQLYPGVKEITVTGRPETYGIVHTTTEYIQILCTRNPELFEWIAADASSLHHLPGQLVVGGFQDSEMGVLYVGRVNYAGWKIGKVSGYHYNEWDRLYIPEGQNEVMFNSYQVLVYKGVKNATFIG